MKKFSFSILGEPVAKDCPRFICKSDILSSSPRIIPFEQWVRDCFQRIHPEEHPFDSSVPLCMEVQTYHNLPENATKKERKAMKKYGVLLSEKPDLGNLLSMIKTGLKEVAYYDDCQIVESNVKKFYGTNERIEIRIWEKKSFP